MEGEENHQASEVACYDPSKDPSNDPRRDPFNDHRKDPSIDCHKDPSTLMLLP